MVAARLAFLHAEAEFEQVRRSASVAIVSALQCAALVALRWAVDALQIAEVCSSLDGAISVAAIVVDIKPVPRSIAGEATVPCLFTGLAR